MENKKANYSRASLTATMHFAVFIVSYVQDTHTHTHLTSICISTCSYQWDWIENVWVVTVGNVLDVNSLTMALAWNLLTWNAMVVLEWIREQVGAGSAQLSVQHELHNGHQHTNVAALVSVLSLLLCMNLARLSYLILRNLVLVHTCSWSIAYVRLFLHHIILDPMEDCKIS